MSFEQGQNWKAKNAASIRLRAGDGKKHAVETRTFETHLTEEQRAAAAQLREQRQQELTRQREAQEARRQGAARDSRAEARSADRDHTPTGWKPANQRKRRNTDPLAQENDPRVKADRERQRVSRTPNKKPKRRRIIRPGN